MIGILKNLQSFFFQEKTFLPKFGQNGNKKVYLDFLKNFVIAFSPKKSKMKTNIADVSPPIPYLAKIQLWSCGPKYCQQNQILGMQTNIEVFNKLILSFWVCVARFGQSTQNNKFAYLCNI